MLNIPQFTPQENLRRISMDKETGYILVEGSFDVPIYSELVDTVSIKNFCDSRVVLDGGGKEVIDRWYKDRKPENVKIIFDLDFDSPEDFDESILILERYSIENYFFEEAVVSPLVSNLLKISLTDVDKELSLAELVGHWNEKLSSLIPVLYYYQKEYLGNKSGWSGVFLNKDRGCWRLCDERIFGFKESLLNEMGVEEGVCINAYDMGFIGCKEIKDRFPGKILIESFYRYLREQCNNIKSKSYSCIVSSVALISALSARLSRNRDLEKIVEEALGI